MKQPESDESQCIDCKGPADRLDNDGARCTDCAVENRAKTETLNRYYEWYLHTEMEKFIAHVLQGGDMKTWNARN